MTLSMYRQDVLSSTLRAIKKRHSFFVNKVHIETVTISLQYLLKRYGSNRGNEEPSDSLECKVTVSILQMLLKQSE